MEDGLVLVNNLPVEDIVDVLILIVVEDGLVRPSKSVLLLSLTCLNPYCSGRWSRTNLVLTEKPLSIWVLIFIVVDDGLVPASADTTIEAWMRLNPYCSGRWSRTYYYLYLKNLI